MLELNSEGRPTPLNRCLRLFQNSARTGKAAILASLFLVSGSADAKIVYVNGSSPTAGNGTSWAKPFLYLRDALENSFPGDQVYVAKGTYYPDDGVTGFFGDRELSFEVNGLKIYGGFNGTEANLSQRDPVANPTILSGEIWAVTPDTLGYERYWSLHVVVLKSSSTLDGLTIEKGRANGDEAPYNQGGGVLAPSGTILTANNCTFSGNLANEAGGAVWGTVVATDCVFSDNLVNNEHLLSSSLDKPHNWLFSSDCSGGAISGDLVTATGCKFQNNMVQTRSLDRGITIKASGGAIQGTTIILKSCYFNGNSVYSRSRNPFVQPGGSDATSRGGAVAGFVTASNCDFVNNSSSAFSSADVSKDPTKAKGYTATPTATGGAISGRVDATSCSFAQNTADGEGTAGDKVAAQVYGGAVYADGVSNLVNCTLVQNIVERVENSSSTNPDDLSTLTFGRGGGLHVAVGSTTILSNSTFLDNSSTDSGAAVSCFGDLKILSNIFWATDDSVQLFVGDPYGNGKSRISNRIYPTPTTETVNIVKGGILGVGTYPGADVDFGEPPARTVINKDPLFVNIDDPIGPDGLWRTSDDGLRLTVDSPAVGKGIAFFLPKDTADLDGNSNTAERIPIDAAGFVRVQGGGLDLGAFEQGDLVYAPDIEVEQPIGTALVDGVTGIDFTTSQGIAKTFVIRNDGLADLKNLVITGDGVDIASFKFTQPGSTTLANGAITSFTVTFLPRFSGIRQAAIHISSNDPDETPFDIDLSGDALLPDIGVEYPVGTPLVDEVSTVGFGNISANSSVTKRFTVNNSGLGNLKIEKILTSGTNAKNFTASAPGQTLLVPGATTTFDVTFTPAGTGSQAASIVIENSDPDGESSFVIKVTGGGVGVPEISVNQPFSNELVDGQTNAFGSVKVTSSYSKTFVIRNIGSAVLKNISVSLSGSGTFTATKLAVKQLDPGGQVKFTVTFKPTALGSKTSVLKIGSNDADESLINITLTGKGVSKSSSSAFSRAAAAGFNVAPEVDRAAGAVTVNKAADDSKYLVLTVQKTEGWELSKHTIEVSPNLVNWFSGANHTTTLLDSPTVLKVRDNTPINGGKKRYIRLK